MEKRERREERNGITSKKIEKQVREIQREKNEQIKEKTRQQERNKGKKHYDKKLMKMKKQIFEKK